MMIEFTPVHTKKNLAGYVICLIFSVISAYLFIQSEYTDLIMLLFPLLMVVYFFVSTKYILIKSIVFDDALYVRRFLWEEVIIPYDTIEHITFARLKTDRKIIKFQGIDNKEELLNLLIDKMDEGKIIIDPEKTQKEADKQSIDNQFGVISAVLLVIVMSISEFLLYHLVNGIFDGLAVWSILCLIVHFILNRKLN